MEPERGELPAQLRDVAPGDPLEPVGDQRILDLPQLLIERVGVRVRTGPRAGLARDRGTRATQSLRDEPEPLAVRLIREAAAQLAICLGQLFSVPGESRRERLGDTLVGGRDRDRLHQTKRDRLVAVQDVVGLDAQRVCRQLRGHGRVPVPVPADPRPETQECRRSRRT